MQPFGLLNFIKSVLEKDGTANEQPPEPNSAPQTPSEPAPVAEPQPPTRNSFVDFCTAHDERAKRIRKK